MRKENFYRHLECKLKLGFLVFMVSVDHCLEYLLSLDDNFKKYTSDFRIYSKITIFNSNGRTKLNPDKIYNSFSTFCYMFCELYYFHLRESQEASV